MPALRSILATCTAILVTITAPATHAHDDGGHREAGRCSRACLNDRLDGYLAALSQHSPDVVDWAEGARFTENSIALRPGEGLWATAGQTGQFRRTIADPDMQSIVFLGTVEENGNQAILGLRLQFQNGMLAEAEHLVVRNPAAATRFAERLGGAGAKSIEGGARALSRSVLAAAPDSYFDAIEHVTARDASFAPNCVRIENGVQTTGVEDLASGPFLELDSESWRAVLAQGCAASIDSGANAHITGVVHRRLLAVDEVAGVALASAVFEHAGTIAQIERGRNTIIFPRQLRQPFDTLIFESFALDQQGRIQIVEAIGIQLPHGTQSGW